MIPAIQHYAIHDWLYTITQIKYQSTAKWQICSQFIQNMFVMNASGSGNDQIQSIIGFWRSVCENIQVSQCTAYVVLRYGTKESTQLTLHLQAISHHWGNRATGKCTINQAISYSFCVPTGPVNHQLAEMLFCDAMHSGISIVFVHSQYAGQRERHLK